MAKSVKEHMSNCKVIACIVEDKMPDKTKSLDTYFDDVILAKNLGFPNFEQFVFQYNQAQASCACKAQLLLYLLERYKDHNYFVFLDADTKVFGPFNELLDYLERKDIMLSPHFVHLNKDRPLSHLHVIHLSGIFNTGLFAIKRGNESYKFLHWWADILLKFCYTDKEKGLFNEQKWLDLAPGQFEFCIQNDPGYNVGLWNFHERLFTLNDNQEYMVNEKPLRLFHFSGIYNSLFDKKMKKTDHNQMQLIDNLKTEYMQELVKVDKNLLRETPWSYDYFVTGHPIHKESRKIFREKPELFNHIGNPFLKDNKFFLSSLEPEQKAKNSKKANEQNKKKDSKKMKQKK
ncbi:hypothetical protein [Petroclostridium sp. X23]|uniref:hypothetical protein n=1 Tax=Petroclostridium sp. X23 TaxID=3045146 RepID=UPI0024ADA207|nr:hypothetical protein [Petroclostridium sp. X23]WHH59686.1 hypothetical protein QKW49_02680 [Petroclostridium sp. X23]